MTHTVKVKGAEAFKAGEHEGCASEEKDHTHIAGWRIIFDPSLVLRMIPDAEEG